MELCVGDQFDSFELVEKAVDQYSEANFHPLRVDNKEKFKPVNKKLSDNAKITDVPEDGVYSCRLIFTARAMLALQALY